MSFVSAVKLTKVVNYVAAQLRIDRKRLKKTKDPEDVQNPEVEAAAAAKVEEMLNTFDENLGKLDKKVKELTLTFNVAFELMKEFDKTRKRGGHCGRLLQDWTPSFQAFRGRG